MDVACRMTVPPALPGASQSRDSIQVARQTVSIRSASPPLVASPLLGSTEAGATVFVGGSAPAANSVSTRGRIIPEVQSANGHQRHSSLQLEEGPYRHRFQQQPAHVVKIKISPDGNKNTRVISTVRLTLDGNSPSAIQDSAASNGVARERSSIKRDGGAVLASATKIVNDGNGYCASAGASEACVRISVRSSADCTDIRDDYDRDSNERNNNNNEKNRNKNVESIMVQREPSDNLNSSSPTNRSSPCFYYSVFQSPLTAMSVMSSGQCSPSETLDSGTCSDLDGTPPPLPKKKNAAGGTNGINGKSTTIIQPGANQLDRASSLTSSGAEVEDSDDNESNISCDSLNARERAAAILQVSEGTSEYQPRVDDLAKQVKVTDNHLDLEKRAVARTVSSSDDGHESDVDSSKSPEPNGAERNGRLSSSSSPVVIECTYEERKQEQERTDDKVVYTRQDGKRYLYEDDRFYKFHVNEFQNDKESNGTENGAGTDVDECFAGYKILDREAIRSAKGTVRGVKNRVRAGIATFLQKPSSKLYKEKEAGRIVVYFTSSGIIRLTYYDCIKVRQILRTHMVKIEERDLFHCTEYQTELRDRLGCDEIKLPQVFVDGQYIGDFNTIERLNESGELRLILKPFKDTNAWHSTCGSCGNYRLRLCPICNGSKRSVLRNNFTTEFIGLRCTHCNDVGLVRCVKCL